MLFECKDIAKQHIVIHWALAGISIGRNIKQGSRLYYAIKYLVLKLCWEFVDSLTTVCPWWADAACFSICWSGLCGSTCTIIPRGARTHWQS